MLKKVYRSVKIMLLYDHTQLLHDMPGCQMMLGNRRGVDYAMSQTQCFSFVAFSSQEVTKDTQGIHTCMI